MKFIDETGRLVLKSSGLCLLVMGAALSGCSSMKEKPVATTTIDMPTAPTAEEISSEPDLERLARERAAKGESKSRESDGKSTAAAADTSKGPDITAPLDETQKQLARTLQADFERALGLMKEGRLDEAYAILDDLQGKAPAFSGPALNQALIRLRQKKPAEATELLKKAQVSNAKNPYVWNLTGYAEKQQGHFKAAREAYEKALELSPNYGKAHFNLAVLSDMYLLDLPAALKHYEAYQALQAQPDPTVAKWIIDLQKRTGVYKAPAKKAAVEEITEDPAPVPAPADASAPATTTPADNAGATASPAAASGTPVDEGSAKEAATLPAEAAKP